MPARARKDGRKPEVVPLLLNAEAAAPRPASPAHKPGRNSYPGPLKKKNRSRELAGPRRSCLCVTGAPLASGLNKRSSFLPTLEAGPTAAVEADPASGPYLAASPYAHVVTSKNISTRSDKALNFGISEQQCNEKIAQIHGVWRNPTCIHLGQGWLVCHRVWGLLTLTREWWGPGPKELLGLQCPLVALVMPAGRPRAESVPSRSEPSLRLVTSARDLGTGRQGRMVGTGAGRPLASSEPPGPPRESRDGHWPHPSPPGTPLRSLCSCFLT
ncbi:unnamed protein product [Rangifer tarandus platyrhynchus]|uniref:Uncharacterized protein n=2 Tax=Rangifer tarandus platyrhynchus TaxID=3082113 RepID=A0ABN9A217_RANTA|nr:unnamed protein product [Rangifer tarandus platyrhynchus]CAI9712056.1 unnamed protein product [Rangifer tarandus platyrhynchus]